LGRGGGGGAPQTKLYKTMPKSRGSRRSNAQRRRKTMHGARRTQRRGLSPPVSHSHERTFPDITHTDQHRSTDPGSVTRMTFRSPLYIVCANGLHVLVRRVLLTRPTSIHNNSPPSLYCSAPVEGLRGSSLHLGLHMITILHVPHDCMIIACLLKCLFNYMHSSSQVPAVSCLLLPVDRTTAVRHRVTTPLRDKVCSRAPPARCLDEKWFCLRAPNRERTTRI
jgi:hypothetical protein